MWRTADGHGPQRARTCRHLVTGIWSSSPDVEHHPHHNDGDFFMQQAAMAATPFYGFFDGKGGIYVQDMNGQRQVGVSVERYQEMERVANEAVAKAEDYHKQLVDAGLIQPKRSPEEQLADLTGQVGAMMQQFGVMTQQNMALSQQVSDLTQKIAALTGGKNDEFSQHSQDVAAKEQPVAVKGGSGAAACGPVQPGQKRRP